MFRQVRTSTFNLRNRIICEEILSVLLVNCLFFYLFCQLLHLNILLLFAKRRIIFCVPNNIFVDVTNSYIGTQPT